jgi:hypothetical protein
MPSADISADRRDASARDYPALPWKAPLGLPGNPDGGRSSGAPTTRRRYDEAAEAYGKAVELRRRTPTTARPRLILGLAGDLDKGPLSCRR